MSDVADSPRREESSAPSCVEKPIRGRMGDPRMNRAVSIRLKYPSMRLVDALRMGGFVFSDNGKTPKRNAVGPDGVTILQRSNQLCRRLREERKRQNLQRKQQAPKLLQKKDPECSTADADAPDSCLKKRPLVGSHSRETTQKKQKVVNGTLFANSRASADVSFVRTSDVADDSQQRTKPPMSEALPLKTGKNSRDDAGKTLSMKMEESKEGPGLVPSASTVIPASHSMLAKDNQRSGENMATSVTDFNGRPAATGKFGFSGLCIGGLLPQDRSQQLLSVTIKSLLAEMRAHVEVLLGGWGITFPLQLVCALRSETDDLLELFLLEEKMDPMRAATRLVKYWVRRFELFGNDKFHLCLNLPGAAPAGNATSAPVVGSKRIIPPYDSSGRRIVYGASSLQTHGGINKESMPAPL